MTTDTEGLIEPRIIMRAGQCGKHQRALCSGCLAAWESNDHRIQTLEAEVERLSALQQPDERDDELARLRDALARTQWMLETIDRTNSTNFHEVRERIVANRAALRAKRNNHDD